MMEKVPLTIAEIGYIAGLFDGEGCVTCKQKPTKRADRGGKIYNQWYIRCEIAMANQEVITWIHETLGFGWSREKIYKKRPKHYKRQWRCAVDTETHSHLPNSSGLIPRLSFMA